MIPFYDSPAAERCAVRRAVARAGCRLVDVLVEKALLSDTSGISVLSDRGGQEAVLITRIECVDGWKAAELLLSLAIEDSETDGARDLARDLRAEAPEDEAFARAIQAFVQKRIRFVREEGELFQSGARTLARGEGDCDDHFRLAFAIARAGGLGGGLGILYHDLPDGSRSSPAHAGSVFFLDGKPVWAETTVAAGFGEEPNAAARRLGLTSERSDIAKGVVIMKESDLAPLPDGFRDRNDPGQVLLDCEALQRLGYYPAGMRLVCDPTVVQLRLAALDFQRSNGMKADGLLGPATRLSILHVLQKRGTEGFGYPGMGDVVGGGASADLDDDDLRALIGLATRYRAQGSRIAAEDFAQVWTAESGLTNIQTKIRDKNGNALPFGGYNQMGPDERRNAGFSGSLVDWLSLRMKDQIPFITDYYDRAARAGGGAACFADAGSLYVANFAPALMRQAGDLSAVLYKAPLQAYELNKGLDHGKKGWIDVRDMKIAVDSVAGNARFIDVRNRLRALGADPASPASSAGKVVGVLALVGIAGAIGAHLKGWI